MIILFVGWNSQIVYYYKKKTRLHDIDPLFLLTILYKIIVTVVNVIITDDTMFLFNPFVTFWYLLFFLD